VKKRRGMSLLFEFTFLDWMILVLLVVSIVSSIIKGFARETISLASVIVGLLLASWFFPLFGHFFGSFVKTQDIASLLGFATIFFGCVLLGAVISLIVNKLLKAARLKWFDRLLGAAFGLLRGWLIGAVLFLMLTAFPVQLESVKNARLSPYLLAGARALALVTPNTLKAKFLEGYRKVEKYWKETLKS
jgi:membrane protein required for colicin V production